MCVCGSVVCGVIVGVHVFAKQILEEFGRSVCKIKWKEDKTEAWLVNQDCEAAMLYTNRVVDGDLRLKLPTGAFVKGQA